MQQYPKFLKQNCVGVQIKLQGFEGFENQKINFSYFFFIKLYRRTQKSVKNLFDGLLYILTIFASYCYW